MDIMSEAQRSERMRRIRARDTKPEMLVRRLVHGMGYRYRLHSRRLPGRPDMVFAGRRKVIYVHGCLWHSHEGCKLNRPPKSRLEYWEPKLARNRERDQQNQNDLREQGWDILVIWECEIKDTDALSHRVREFLGPKGSVPVK